jgi:hypothetical protein
MRDYGKVHTSFWTSPNIRELSDDGRALAIYLLTCPHGTIAGVFRLPDGYACEDLQWDTKRMKKTLAELLANGFATRCETTKWVWVTKHFVWNPPENPNQKKSAAKIVMQIPDECSWKADFIGKCGVYFGFDSTKSEPFRNPSETLAEPLPNQEQEQDINIHTSVADELLSPDKPTTAVEQKPDDQPAKAKNASAPRFPPCPAEQIVELYQEALPELPSVRVMDDSRKKLIANRWKWVLSSTKTDGSRRAESAKQAVDWFRDFFELTRENDFLMGRTPRVNGHANWKCDIDFLMSDKGLKQVLEKTGVAA